MGIKEQNEKEDLFFLRKLKEKVTSPPILKSNFEVCETEIDENQILARRLQERRSALNEDGIGRETIHLVPKQRYSVNSLSNQVPYNERQDSYIVDSDRDLAFVPKGKSISQSEKIANYTFTVGHVEEICAVDENSMELLLKERAFQIIVYPSSTSGLSESGRVVRIKNAKNIAEEIHNQIPELYIYPSCKLAKQHVGAVFSQSIAKCNRLRVIHDVGWHLIDGQYCYASGSGVIGHAIRYDVACNSDKKIEYNLNIPPIEAGKKFLKMFEICNKSEEVVPVVLYGVSNLLFTQFKLAGFPIQFLLYLCGRTNSKKTSMAKVIANVFNFSGNKTSASTKDTKNAVEIKLWEYKDSTLILDDVHPSESRCEISSQEELLSSVFRAIGDNNPKQRMGSNLKTQKNYTPRGGCIVTGEFLIGNRSDLSRSIVVDINENSVNLEVLTELQNSGAEISTNWYYFLRFCAGQFQNIVEHIRNRYFELRYTYRNISTMQRSVENFICLLISGEIMLKYLVEIGCITQDSAQLYLENWKAALVKNLKAYDQNVQSVHPAKIYINMLQGLIDEGKYYLIELESATADSIEPNLLGFRDEAFYYFIADKAYTLVKSRFQAIGKTFPLDKNATHKALQEIGAIEYIEKNSDGEVSKISRTMRINLSREVRPSVIKIRRSVWDSVIGEEI